MDPIEQARPLDEVALRKEGFHEGIRVALGDGQKWALPKRGYVLFPVPDADGKITVGGRWYYGQDVDHDYRRAIGEVECGPGDRLNAMIGLAAALLMRNYDLAIDDLRTLISYTPGDERSDAMWLDFLRAAQGVDPYAPPAVEEPEPAPVEAAQPAA